jgi:hypothetical protein
MNNPLTAETIRKQHLVFVGTSGVGAQNRSGDFKPAFYNVATGQAELSRFADGRTAPMHLLEGLPDLWVLNRDAQGRASVLKDTVIAGFIRGGFFYTREQAAAAALQREQE